jgi:hypothetical protein
MILSFQNFQTLVQNSAAAVQGASSQLLNLTVGSTLRAILQANASIALWIQWLITQTLSASRLGSSLGQDVDTYVGDFSLVRLPAVAATGLVTFSRISTGVATLVPFGAQARTADTNSPIFSVIADTTNPAWDAVQVGYDLAAATSSVTVPVQALTSGSAGNAQANSITLLASAVPGIDAVNNAAAFTTGIDAETDVALKARFVLFISGLSKATLAAVGFAIVSTQQGLNYNIVENSPAAGFFVVVVDDGTGNPSLALQQLVFSAVDLVRPVGTSFTVIAPILLNVFVTLSLTVAAGINKLGLLAAVDTAVVTFINALQIGQTLSYTKLAQVAYDAATAGAITNVTLLRINGAAVDIVVGPTTVIKCTSCVAS